MKQTTRQKVFETNSSTYHTLTIRKIQDDKKGKEIEKGKDLIINNENIPITRFPSWSESYISTARSTYEKAQFVLRFLGYELEEQLDDLVDESQYTNRDGSWDSDKRIHAYKDVFFDTPLIKAFVKAIKRYIGQERNVVIEFTDDWYPFITCISDDGKSFDELFGLSSKEDRTNIDKLSDVFYDIIFNPEIEMIEECESNE